MRTIIVTMSQDDAGDLNIQVRCEGGTMNLRADTPLDRAAAAVVAAISKLGTPESVRVTRRGKKGGKP